MTPASKPAVVQATVRTCVRARCGNQPTQQKNESNNNLGPYNFYATQSTQPDRERSTPRRAAHLTTPASATGEPMAPLHVASLAPVRVRARRRATGRRATVRRATHASPSCRRCRRRPRWRRRAWRRGARVALSARALGADVAPSLGMYVWILVAGGACVLLLVAIFVCILVARRCVCVLLNSTRVLLFLFYRRRFERAVDDARRRCTCLVRAAPRLRSTVAVCALIGAQRRRVRHAALCRLRFLKLTKTRARERANERAAARALARTSEQHAAETAARRRRALVHAADRHVRVARRRRRVELQLSVTTTTAAAAAASDADNPGG